MISYHSTQQHNPVKRPAPGSQAEASTRKSLRYLGQHLVFLALCPNLVLLVFVIITLGFLVVLIFT
jgi:hypothetical protein